MRALTSIAALGLFAVSGTIYAQALTEHAAAAAGATIGTAAGKPVSNALSGVFTQVDSATATAAATGKTTPVPPNTKAAPDPEASKNHGGAPGSFSPGFGGDSGSAGAADAASQGTRSRRRGASVAASGAAYPTLAPIPEPVKEPSLEEVAGVKIGTSEKDLFAALGKPASHVSVPDDDGHMRESCQFWANGRQLGTVRLDNGQVVKVEVRPQD